MTNQAIRWLTSIPLTVLCSVAAFAADATGSDTTPQQMKQVVVVVVRAPGATGTNITPEQFKQIVQGMPRDEVLKTLGKPRFETKFGNQEGPTWVYRMLERGDFKAFVDFDVIGAVVGTSEKMELIGGSETGN